MSNRDSSAEVFLIKTADRKEGIQALTGRLDLTDFAGRQVALKANYNSSDPFPASTHVDTLEGIVNALKRVGAGKVTLGERSGMGNTRRVLEHTGVFDLAEKIGFNVEVFDEAAKENWVKVERLDTHWLRGFHIARLFAEAQKVVQTCCLKAHRFGGHFTLSLKNSVGLVAKKLPHELYDYMWELHSSPHQRHLIAEINKHYNVDFVIMDGIKAFVDGGPERGKVVEPNIMLASTDRVAIDAVGVAVLRSFGSTNHIMNGRIFELEQIQRAAELGVGVKSAERINLIGVNPESSDEVCRISEILKRDSKSFL